LFGVETEKKTTIRKVKAGKSAKKRLGNKKLPPELGIAEL
jgi:hypothetical protein